MKFKHNQSSLPLLSEEQPLVSLRNAGIKRNGRWLVRHIDLDIFCGEIITLIGPNGSGKSTTAKMILDIFKPTEGNVKRMNGVKIGYVPQKLDFDPALPLSIARLMQLTGPIDQDAMEKSLHEVGMYHMRNADVSTLSGGELQRILLARASARKPALMVLDEPLQGVDFSGEIALYRQISEYRDQLNCGIILISHDLHTVMAASDKVLCLNGYICCSGKPQDVVVSKEYTALFGEQDKRTLALYEHHHEPPHTKNSTPQ